MSQIINESQYNELIQNGKIVVQFSANWCGPCKVLKRSLSSMMENYNFDFRVVDVEIERELAASKGIRSLPYVEVISAGEVKHQFTGAKPVSQLDEIFSTIFG